MGDNLEHLQDNMCLTAHINSSSDHMGQLEHRLGQVGSVLMGMIEGAIEREGLTETSSSSGSGGSAASGNDQDDQGGVVVSEDVGPSSEMRRDSPMPRETRLIAEMERCHCYDFLVRLLEWTYIFSNFLNFIFTWD